MTAQRMGNKGYNAVRDDRPLKPENFMVIPNGEDSVTMTWEISESESDLPISGFVVEQRDVTNKTSCWDNVVTVGPNTMRWEVSKLIKGNEYEFQVATLIDETQSDWAKTDAPIKIDMTVVQLPTLLSSNMSDTRKRLKRIRIEYCVEMFGVDIVFDVLFSRYLLPVLK